MSQKEQAFQTFLSADFKQAEKLFADLLQSEPNDVELRFGHALSLAQQGFFKEAADILEILSLEMPESLEIKTALWQTEIQLGRYRLVATSVVDTYKKDRRNVDLCVIYLKELRQLGAWFEARNLIDDVLKHSEQDHLGFLLETCLFHMECPVGDQAMALAQLAALSEIDPSDPAIAMAFAHALIRSKQAERAIEVLQPIEAVGVQGFEVQAHLAWAKLSAGQIQEAQALLYPLEGIMPHDPLVLIVGAYLAAEYKNYVKAMRGFSAVLNEYEGFLPEVQVAADIALRHLNNAQLALACYQKLIVVEGADYQHLLLVIWLAYSAHKNDIAQKFFAKAKALFPHEASNEVMDVLLNEQDENFGERFMQLVPKLSAGSNMFHDYALAIYHTITGKIDVAIACLEHALQNVPYDALLTKALVELLIRQEQWDKVFSIGEAFLKIMPYEYELRSQLIFAALLTNDYGKTKYHDLWIVSESFTPYREWLEKKWAEFDDVKDALAEKQNPLELMDAKRARTLYVLWQASATAAVLAVQNLEGVEARQFLDMVQQREQTYQIRALLQAFDEKERDGLYMHYFDSMLSIFKNQDRLDDILAYLQQEEAHKDLILNYQVYKIYALVNSQRFDEALTYLGEFVDFETQTLRDSVQSSQLVVLADAVMSVVGTVGGYDDFAEKLFYLAHDYAKSTNSPHLDLIEHNFSWQLRGIGQWVKAEQLYGESSYKLGSRAPNRQFMVPLWRGESLEGKTILVWREQGIGDELSWSMILPKLYRRAQAEGGKIIFECSKRLLTIFRRTFPEIEINPEETESDLARVDIDCHIPLGMVVAHVQPDFVLPARFERHLHIRPDYLEKWRQRLADLGTTKKIGLSWRSGLTESVRNHYYCEVKDLLPLLALKGVDFVMLNYAHVEEGVREVFAASGVRLHTWDDLDLRDDFEQQIALIANLDLVISPTMTPGVLARCVGTPNWMFMHRAAYAGMPPEDIVETQYPALVWKKYYKEEYFDLMQRMADRLRQAWQLPAA